ncbi:unnamed protein product [Parnassius apollo]|uniref:(apollo) hypothetical protein n=1 Tax=Parnassius apollo TaxID=110799 RepID=A0A8S3XK41_PARAO|nr:unnamed protein product [Parnassius apollo]
MSYEIEGQAPISSYNPCTPTTPAASVHDCVALETGATFHTFTQELHKTFEEWRSDMNNTLTVFKENIKSSLHDWRDEMEASITKLNDDLKFALNGFREEICTLRAEHERLKHQTADISRDVSELKASMLFLSGEQDDFKKKVDGTIRQSTEQSSLTISNLETKVDYLEQQARQCNIEICNIPETRSENLLNIMGSISMAINFPISQKDILSIHRVPHAHRQTNKPKNVIVKLSSRILRDNVLAAFRKVKTLKTDQLGLTGSTMTVYMNEHLTLKKKQLFRKTRDLAAMHQYKYVWVRNATILVREQDGDTAFAIRTDDDLRKIKSRTKGGNKSACGGSTQHTQ